MIKVYLIGVIVCTLWFLFVALISFEKSIYDKSTESEKKHIDIMHETLKDINQNNPQIAFVIVSFIIILFWPITIPYVILQPKSK